MFDYCPICGALWKNKLSCRRIFDEFLALEFSHPTYGKVHMLTVSCFMIQHHRYSDQALIYMQKNLCDVLEKGKNPAEIRLQITSDVDQTKRSWKIVRQPHERKLSPIDWSITIADVYQHKDDPVSYCAWVEKWARATFKEMISPFLPM